MTDADAIYYQLLVIRIHGACLGSLLQPLVSDSDFAGLTEAGYSSSSLSQKRFDRFVDRVLVFNFGEHQRFMAVAKAALQITEELAAAVRAFNLPVTK